MNTEQLRRSAIRNALNDRVWSLLLWLVIIGCIAALLFWVESAGAAQPPFNIELPPGAPPVIEWYIAEPNVTVIFPVEVWTRQQSQLEFTAANADQQGEIWSFAWSEPNISMIDPNLQMSGYKYTRTYGVGWTPPATEGVYYIQVTVSRKGTLYGYHDLRRASNAVDTKTVVFWVTPSNNDVPLIYSEAPVITGRDAQKIWMDLYVDAYKHGSQFPSKPAKVRQ